MSDERFVSGKIPVHARGKSAFLEKMVYPKVPGDNEPQYHLMRMRVLGPRCEYEVYFDQPLHYREAGETLESLPAATPELSGLRMTAASNSFIPPSERDHLPEGTPKHDWHLQVDDAGSSRLRVGDVVVGAQLLDQKPIAGSMAEFGNHPGRRYWASETGDFAPATALKL